mgnify:CR=1 FL=1
MFPKYETFVIIFHHYVFNVIHDGSNFKNLDSRRDS